MLYRPAT
jgi:hypothetical protein